MIHVLKIRNLLRFSVLFLICVLGFSGCATTYNEATGRDEFIFISAAEEVSMGKSVHQQLAQQYKFTAGPQQERVRNIGQRIAQHAYRQDIPYAFYMVEDKQLNAFTVPGGNVYIFRGLVNKLHNDDEIASVLAHEVAHGDAKHTVKKFQASLGYNLIGSLILSQVGDASAAQMARQGTGTIMKVVFSAYGRQDEHEADLLGLKYMQKAGYDLNGMVGAFEVLEAESKGNATPLIFRSHPYTRDRITAVREEIKRMQQALPNGQ